MTKGHPLKGCLFYFPNFFSLIYFFIFGKYENHPRGNSFTVAWPGTARGPAIWQMGKKSEGELAHSCEGRCSPSGSPFFGHALCEQKGRSEGRKLYMRSGAEKPRRSMLVSRMFLVRLRSLRKDSFWPWFSSLRILVSW